MRFIAPVLFALCFLLPNSRLPAADIVSPGKPAFYVATSGRDEWPGTLTQPFGTLQRAQKAARDTGKPAEIQLRGGTYRLDQPLEFSPLDSKLTISAYQKEMPVLSGGRPIAGWREVTIKGRTIWAADLPDVRDGKWSFRELWVNGRRANRARFPHTGYLAIANGIDKAPKPDWKAGQTEFRLKQGEVLPCPSIADSDLVIMNRWVESRLPVINFDKKEGIIACGRRSVFHVDSGDLFYLEGSMEFLSEPGDWHLERKSGTLYYAPRPGESIAQTWAVAPRLVSCVRLQGDAGRQLEGIVFRGVAFSHCEWYFNSDYKPGEAGGSDQAAIRLPSAVTGQFVKNCVFENCTFAHLGAYALELGRGCQNNRITRCEFTDLGGGGIKIGETRIREKQSDRSLGNEVSHCCIHDGGKMFHSAIGIWIGQSSDNRLQHNLIHDFYYSGISIGWTWGYGASSASGNRVEYNHVHHIGRLSNGDGPILSDMGGIYTLGKQPGTVIRNNLWHDIAGLKYGGWGIYFDEGSSDIIAENNLVYNTTHGGFHQHYGAGNAVRNNIFAYGRDQQLQRTRPEEHVSFSFERNIVYGAKGLLCGGKLSDRNYRFESNLYWLTDGRPPVFGQWSWDDWRNKQGQDKLSLIADPLFADPAKANYALSPKSPAFKIGFQKFNMDNVGP